MACRKAARAVAPCGDGQSAVGYRWHGTAAHDSSRPSSGDDDAAERAPRRKVLWYNLGSIPYKAAWDLQKRAVEGRLKDAALPDIVLCLEHPPVYTIGRGGTPANLRFPYDPSDPSVGAEQRNGAEVHRVERGGEVTYHGPGQLVAYPIFNLARGEAEHVGGVASSALRKSLHWYVHAIEEVVIRCVAAYGREASRVEGLRGVWVGDAKIGAVGMAVSSWITYHGLSLNVCPDMEDFKRIIPCGIEDRPVCSLSELVEHPPSMDEARAAAAAAFADVFEVDVECVNGQLPPEFKGRVSVTGAPSM